MRVIQYSNESGSEEFLFFTEDLKTKAEKLIPSAYTVDNDFIIEEDTPKGFPLEYHFKRSYLEHYFKRS